MKQKHEHEVGGEQGGVQGNAPKPSGSVRDLKKFDAFLYDECMDLFRNFLKQRDLSQYTREERRLLAFSQMTRRSGCISAVWTPPAGRG